METFPISDFGTEMPTRELYYEDEELDEVVRIRLLSDPGFPVWDISYIWGRAKNGELVRLSGYNFQLPKKQPIKALIREWPKLPSLVRTGYVNDVVSRLM